MMYSSFTSFYGTFIYNQPMAEGRTNPSWCQRQGKVGGGRTDYN
jgi:hypothetical protein